MKLAFGSELTRQSRREGSRFRTLMAAQLLVEKSSAGTSERDIQEEEAATSPSQHQTSTA